MLSSRELIDTQLRGGQGDRIAVMDSPWGDTITRWVSEGYPTDDKGNPVDAVDHFGYDMCGVGGWFDLHPLRGFSEVVEETDEWQVVRNGSGAALKWWKNKSGTPEHVDFRMTSREIWERDYRAPPLRPRPRPPRPGRDQEGTGTPTGPGPMDPVRPSLHLGAHAGKLGRRLSLRKPAARSRLDSRLLPRQHRLLQAALRRAHGRSAASPDGIWLCEDLGYKNGLFCSTKVLAELIFPYFAELSLSSTPTRCPSSSTPAAISPTPSPWSWKRLRRP